MGQPIKKILWLSDMPFINTGYSTISRNILNGLAKRGYECHILGNGYMGQTLPPGVRLKDGFTFDFWVHGQGKAPYFQDLLGEKLQEIQPDYFGVLLDTFMIYPWIMQQNFSPAKSFFYFPSDGGGGLPVNCENVLKHFNASVAMARYGQTQAKAYYDLNTSYIPHAVHTNVFFPMPKADKDLIRESFNGFTVGGGNTPRGFLNDKFIVGTVARNQGRKMLDRTLKAFKLFAEKCPNAILLMHSDPVDNAAVFDIRQLIWRFDLVNKVVFTKMKFHENLEYSEMNKIYNMMDVFILSTSGEGFGIPIIEAMSCGIPCVVTDYTTTHELLVENGLCGLPIPLADTYHQSSSEILNEAKGDWKNFEVMQNPGTISGSWGVERGIMSVPDCAQALQTLAQKPEMRKELGETGRKKVLSHYNWDFVIPAWDNFLRSL